MLNNHFVEENHLLSFALLQVLFYLFQLMMLYQQVVLYRKDLLLLVKFLYTKLNIHFGFFYIRKKTNYTLARNGTKSGKFLS
jgi:hypothetical protein